MNALGIIGLIWLSFYIIGIPVILIFVREKEKKYSHFPFEIKNVPIWLRGGNFLIDFVLVSGFYKIIETEMINKLSRLFGISIYDSSTLQDFTKLMGVLIYPLIYFLYYTIIEYFTNGRTVGKYITKTKAISKYEGRIGIRSCIRRSLVRLIPWDLISFVVDEDSWSFVSGKGFLHDSLSDTAVVKIKLLK